MLSKDELDRGLSFILKLQGSDGSPVQWVETLRGESAVHWFEIYRTSNWDALRAEAAGVFHHRMTEAETETALTTTGRCIVIKTDAVTADQLACLTAER